MLIMNDTNMNFNAMSQDSNQTTIASMNASYSGGNSLYFAVNIDDMDADLNNIKSDFSNFIDRVITIVKRNNQA